MFSPGSLSFDLGARRRRTRDAFVLLMAALVAVTSLIVGSAARPASVLAAGPADPSTTTITADASDASVDDGVTITVTARDAGRRPDRNRR